MCIGLCTICHTTSESLGPALLATPTLLTLNKRLCSLLGIYYSLYFSRRVPFAFVPSKKMGMPSYTTCHSSCPAGSLYRLLFCFFVCAPMYYIHVVFYNHKDGPTGRLTAGTLPNIVSPILSSCSILYGYTPSLLSIPIQI